VKLDEIRSPRQKGIGTNRLLFNRTFFILQTLAQSDIAEMQCLLVCSSSAETERFRAQHYFGVRRRVCVLRTFAMIFLYNSVLLLSMYCRDVSTAALRNQQ
jgi:hypothetical protein